MRKTLDLFNLSGLSEEDVLNAIRRDGYNEIPSQKKRGIAAIALEVIREPMFILLVSAGGIYLFMGELGDALMLLGFVCVVMGITITQERRTERALDALRDLSSPRALVVRGGLRRRVPGREVVCNDVLILSEGDRVPADAILRRAINLSVDESLLTGESVPVRKKPSTKAQALERPGGDDLPSLFSGTLVTAGQGVAEVVSTGSHTELGKIGKALELVQPESTLLQKETNLLVRNLAAIGLLACALTVVVYGITRGGGAAVWKEGFLAGITMAMATLPEELPVVLTVFLALGAWRISRSQVLTRRMPAIESLGAATVLCVDKTGTLTQNQMTLKRLMTYDQSIELVEKTSPLPPNFNELLMTAVMASKADPFDPMEKAILTARKEVLADISSIDDDWLMVKEYPLTPEMMTVSQAWQRKTVEKSIVISSKGAPEAIADLCHMTQNERELLAHDVIDLASKGLRVLGVASAKLNSAELPEEHHDLPLKFLGLIGFEDPLRPTVPAAVAKCQEAGIRVVMITGDYPATAQSIARAAGLSNHETVITGPDLEQMSDDVLTKQIKNVQIFARVVPEQKLRLVTALKANGEVVAMTGDGVNDAPALKAAHIGIAMGGRGTDVAREAAALVLLDDDFSSIVAAIQLGRRIFDNIKKAIAFIFAVHVPIAGLSILPVFFADWPLLLLPIHIVFLELIIDPSCSLIFEAEDAEINIMSRPPRNPTERLFSLKTIGLALLQGLSVLLVCLGVFVFSRGGHSPDAARALTFLTLVVSFIVIILVNRSWTRTIIGSLGMPNKALWWVIGGTALFLSIVLIVPAMQKMFHFEPIHGLDMALSLFAGLICVMWFEVLKLTKWLKSA